MALRCKTLLTSSLRKLLPGVLLGGALCWSAGTAAAATITVTSGADDITNNGNCTLREAILAVNSQARRDACPAGNGSNDTIVSASSSPVQSLGNLLLTRNVTLSGGYVTFQNQNLSFVVGDSTHAPTVTFQKMYIADTGVAAIFITSGTAVVDYSTIENAGNNSSSGGAISVGTNQFLRVTHSFLGYNKGYQGGAIHNGGTTAIFGSTIIASNAEHGGAIASYGSISIDTSTIAKNVAGAEGGALFLASGTAFISNSTIAYNTSNSGVLCPTGCAAIQANGSTSITIQGTVVANNDSQNNPSVNSNCKGNLFSSGWNLLGESTSTACVYSKSSTDLSPQSPKLLVDSNNFPTYLGYSDRPVYLPTTDSPLVNAIPVGQPGNGLCNNNDERGVARSRGEPKCDIGAVEQASMLYVQNTNPDTDFDVNLRSLYTSLGFGLTVKDDDSVTAADANGKQIVFISQTVESSKINTKFRDVTNTVVVDEPNLYSAMKMTGSVQNSDFGVLNNVSGMTILASGLADLMFDAAPLTWTFDNLSTLGFGKPSSAAVKNLLVVGSTSNSPMFSYAKGVNMGFGLVAPGARVGYYAQDGMFIGDGGNLQTNAILYAASL